MAADVERRTSDPHAELLWEDVRIARAKRELIEFELTRRRTLLRLTVALPVVGIILALIGEPYAGGAFLTGAIASGAAAIPRRDDSTR
jgi:hypothetical protein